MNYSSPDGKNNVDVLFSEEDFWMTQGALAELFQTSSQNIMMHIKNFYDEKELLEIATCKHDLQVRIENI